MTVRYRGGGLKEVCTELLGPCLAFTCPVHTVGFGDGDLGTVPSIAALLSYFPASKQD